MVAFIILLKLSLKNLRLDKRLNCTVTKIYLVHGTNGDPKCRLDYNLIFFYKKNIKKKYHSLAKIEKINGYCFLQLFEKIQNLYLLFNFGQKITRYGYFLVWKNSLEFPSSNSVHKRILRVISSGLSLAFWVVRSQC